MVLPLENSQRRVAEKRVISDVKTHKKTIRININFTGKEKYYTDSVVARPENFRVGITKTVLNVHIRSKHFKNHRKNINFDSLKGRRGVIVNLPISLMKEMSFFNINPTLTINLINYPKYARLQGIIKLFSYIFTETLPNLNNNKHTSLRSPL